VSGCDRKIDVPVYWSDPMPFSTTPSSTTRARGFPGSVNPPVRKPAGVKIWMRSWLFGASATANVPLAATAKANGLRMRPGSLPMWTISQVLSPRRPAVDDLTAAIEHECWPDEDRCRILMDHESGWRRGRNRVHGSNDVRGRAPRRSATARARLSTTGPAASN
jgi:hypothetical protein